MSSSAETPLHMQYPAKWHLGPSGPEVVKDYFEWTLADPNRVASAALALRGLGIGMQFLTVAQEHDDDGKVKRKIELNMWTEDFPARVGAGGHAHARNGEIYSYAHPKARQYVRSVRLLPPHTRKLPDMPVEERKLVILNKVDSGDGLGTLYNPVIIGDECLTLDEREEEIPAGTHQRFSSLWIHEVGYQGPGVSVTVQHQGPVEQDALNSFEGLTTYKGLSPEAAEEVIRQRQILALAGKAVDASTVLVRDLDFETSQLEERAFPLPPERYPYLAEAAIRSLELVIKSGIAS
ncbi:MAG TPA: hypothetical protein VFT59_01180 [Candidatus Saccharimonadales bacterium]|nr:hypothetical protein [Candidatus Saccharimonadales bacterium]